MVVLFVCVEEKKKKEEEEEVGFVRCAQAVEVFLIVLYQSININKNDREEGKKGRN